MKRWRIILEAREQGAIGEWSKHVTMEHAETPEAASEQAIARAQEEGLETRFIVGVHEQ